MLPNEDKLYEITHEVQKLLDIRDWDIRLEYADQYKMRCIMNADHYDYAGCCKRHPARKEAVITINTEHGCHTNDSDDWYDTLIHEIYHIVAGETQDLFHNVTDDDLQRKLYDHKVETLVCGLTRTFIRLHPLTNFIKEE